MTFWAVMGSCLVAIGCLRLAANGVRVRRIRESASTGRFHVTRVTYRWSPISQVRFDIEGPEKSHQPGPVSLASHVSCTAGWINTYVSGYWAGRAEAARELGGYSPGQPNPGDR